MEIEVSNPKINSYELRYRRYSLIDGEADKILAEELRRKDITPKPLLKP